MAKIRLSFLQQGAISNGTIAVVALAIILVVIAILIYSLFAPNKNALHNQTANSCTAAPNQFCAEIACVGSSAGNGKCANGLFCCKTSSFPTPSQTSIVLLSDVSFLHLQVTNPSTLSQITNELNLFNNPSASFHNSHRTISQGIIKTISIRVTSINTVPLYYVDSSYPSQTQSQSGYGETFDSRNNHLTIFLYYTTTLLQNTPPTTLTSMIWHTSLLALHTISASSISQTSFLNEHLSSTPLSVSKSS